MKYLAYGSNLLPARLTARCRTARLLDTIGLPGWRLAFHKRGSDGSGKCDLVANPGGCAYGALFELSSLERSILDRIEGVGHGYEVRELPLPGFERVFTYLAEPRYIDPELSPFDWYHRFVLEGARHQRFPKPYLEAIAAVPFGVDPDPARQAAATAVMARHG